MRRKALIDKRFQFGTAGILAIIQILTFVTASLASSWLYLFVLDRRMVCNHNAAFLCHLGVAGAAAIVLLLHWCVRRTHAIAGPIYKTRQLLRAAAEGHLPALPVRFRKKDCFKELADDLNACLSTMQHMHRERQQLMMALEELLASTQLQERSEHQNRRQLQTMVDRINEEHN
jgi:hypothetical protein